MSILILFAVLLLALAPPAESGVEAIAGQYFLRGLPSTACPDSGHDVGSLLTEPPYGYEHTNCGMWIVIHFDEIGEYLPSDTLESIYYHWWVREENAFTGSEFEMGYSDVCDHAPLMVESIPIDTREDRICQVDEWCLITEKQSLNHTLAVVSGDAILDLSLILLGTGPDVLESYNQASFVIFNLPPDSVLMGLDSDGDGLSDFMELFETGTDPYNGDTDHDTFGDALEHEHGTEPNDPGSYLVGLPSVPAAPRSLRLLCEPNPSRGLMRVSFHLGTAGEVLLDVFDVAGRHRRRLISGRLGSGRHAVSWFGRDGRGRPLPAGLYFLSLTAPGGTSAAKVLLLE